MQSRERERERKQTHRVVRFVKFHHLFIFANGTSIIMECLRNMKHLFNTGKTYGVMSNVWLYTIVKKKRERKKTKGHSLVDLGCLLSIVFFPFLSSLSLSLSLSLIHLSLSLLSISHLHLKTYRFCSTAMSMHFACMSLYFSHGDKRACLLLLEREREKEREREREREREKKASLQL